MQSERGDGRIGIGIHPGVAGGSILDGEYLYQTETAFNGPLDEALQVGELPHAHGSFPSKTKNWYRHTGALPDGVGQTDKTIVQDAHLIRSGVAGKAAVRSLLEPDQPAVLFVIYRIFVFDRERFGGDR